MVQLAILSGKTAGSVLTARRFPFSIGRATDSNLQLQEDGVWDRHAVLALESNKGFSIRAEENAYLAVNGQPGASFPLRNGDVIELGGVRAQFWIAPARLRSLTLSETALWAVLAGVTLGQVALVYWLLR